MRVLILGGTSFVGRHLSAAALERGHRLSLFNRGRTNPGVFPEAEHLVGDRSTADLDALGSATWDAVVDVNAYLPRHVREVGQVLGGRVGHCSFVSTVSTYGPAPSPGITEDGPVGRLPDPSAEELSAETYGPLKVLCEEAACAAFPDRTLVLRPGAIVGPFDPAGAFAHWATAMAGRGEVTCPARPEQPVQVIDARDLASFVLDVAEAGVTGTFNCVGPAEPTTFAGFLAALGPAPVRWIDRGEAPMVLPRDGSRDGVLSVSNARARRAGLRLRPLAETAADVRAWLGGEGE